MRTFDCFIEGTVDGNIWDFHYGELSGGSIFLERTFEEAFCGGSLADSTTD